MHTVFRYVQNLFRYVHNLFPYVQNLFRYVHNVFRYVHNVFRYVHTVFTEALRGHRQRNNYLQCWLKILDKMRNIRSSRDKYVKIT